ncbi:MAG: hypothetical protein HS129_16685 [Leptospiraceae bacterium]|nr:hypothetical protein [Leptospiraceae bacterium]
MTTTIQQTEEYRAKLENCLNILRSKIEKIQIGSSKQFPFGWRKAAKGRTVWRIVEEAINQNLEKFHEELGIESIEPSDSEVSVYDTKLKFQGDKDFIYTNIKSAVLGGRTNKDDISKANGLQEFFQQDIDRQLFISTFVIRFDDEMTISLTDCHVMPIMWLPDIYVNPSNNGNLQSSKYKDVNDAIKRTNKEFFAELSSAVEVAQGKRRKKQG